MGQKLIKFFNKVDQFRKEAITLDGSPKDKMDYLINKMKAFIFKYVGELTERYHSGGGLVVIAENLESAKEFVKKDRYCRPTEEEWNKATVYDIEAKEPAMYIFQDAGWC